MNLEMIHRFAFPFGALLNRKLVFGQFGQHLHQRLRIDRLDHMSIEAGFFRPPPIVVQGALNAVKSQNVQPSDGFRHSRRGQD